MTSGYTRYPTSSAVAGVALLYCIAADGRPTSVVRDSDTSTPTTQHQKSEALNRTVKFDSNCAFRTTVGSASLSHLYSSSLSSSALHEIGKLRSSSPRIPHHGTVSGAPRSMSPEESRDPDASNLEVWTTVDLLDWACSVWCGNTQRCINQL
jgi:hypothetical protein